MPQGVFIFGLNVAGPVGKTLIPHRGCGTCPKKRPRSTISSSADERALDGARSFCETSR
jgi:hypothetical protein